MRKNTAIILIFIFFMCMTSCTNKVKKDTAYCFSAVFNFNDDKVDITLYCRVPDKSSSEAPSDFETSLTLSGRNLRDALKSSNSSEYEIYYDSMSAIYLPLDASSNQIIELAHELYNNTKYQTAVMVYNQEKSPSSDFHKLASKVCTDKGIKKEDKNNYVNFTSFVRSKT